MFIRSLSGFLYEYSVNIIMKDLIELMDPKYIEVKGVFYPRGGISIFPFANYGKKGTNYENIAKNRLFESLNGNCWKFVDI